jgi:CRISPR-associated protein Cmr2
MPESSKPQDFWKRKLAAFLHDPPSKCVDLRYHEESAQTLYRQAGFVDEEENRRLGEAYAKPSDWTASSADRFPFPKSRGNISSVFDGVRAQFHHPLSPGHSFPFHAEFRSAEAAMEVDSTVQPIATDIAGWSDADQWRARFFVHWRLWEKFCTERDYRFAFLPADTRIPDHTVWTHMQVVSALDACAQGTGNAAVLRPAFLKFQMGPVQDFIAEARSVRDLWSGSYLLSWLIAAGLKALAMEIGPDSVIYPSLKGQPLFDLHLRDGLWSQVKVNGKSVWEHLDLEKTPKDALEEDWSPSFLTPNLPNVFLAVVPADRASELGKLVQRAIEREWTAITDSSWKYCDQLIPAEEAGFTKAQRRDRFDAQVKQHLSLSFQVTPWPEAFEAALALASQFADGMPIQTARERVRAIVAYATDTMPETDRDGRYYIRGENGPKTQLNNIGLGWSIILALNGWELDAVRQMRAFDGWSAGGWKTGVFCNKDSLGGKAEAVAGGREWKARAETLGGVWKTLFKHSDWLGAATLVKRVWHLAHLKKVWDLPTGSDRFGMPNTRGIAEHDPYSSDEDEDVEQLKGEKYFAVLALDGDDIGKWVSGEKTPPLADQFSSYFDGSHAQKQGALTYFKNHGGGTILATRRPLSPSYHLQFSQALSNFAQHCADPIVKSFDGRLIYAGGDDVLAMLPANSALACAAALRDAFQGRSVPSTQIKASQPGFLSVGQKDQKGRDIAFPVPGPECKCSVGIAMAHFKSPLQDVVRAAHAAEKRAKKLPEKDAVAVTLMKRSGEIIDWACKWDDGGVELSSAIASAMQKKQLSGKFPHRVVELIEPYLLERPGMHTKMESAPGFDSQAVITREFAHALDRQAQVRGGEKQKLITPLSNALATHLAHLKALGRDPVEGIIGLCQTVAFSHRTRSDSAERHDRP